jgi:hypothetical protein
MPSKTKRRVKKPQASPNEQKLEMVTSRASNAYAQIHQEMSRAMGLFKQGTSGKKYSKSSSNLVTESYNAAERAVRLTDALKRDLMAVIPLMSAIVQEQVQQATQQIQVPFQTLGPRPLEV